MGDINEVISVDAGPGVAGLREFTDALEQASSKWAEFQAKMSGGLGGSGADKLAASMDAAAAKIGEAADKAAASLERIGEASSGAAGGVERMGEAAAGAGGSLDEAAAGADAAAAASDRLAASADEAAGALDRHPRLKIIIGHMGEMLPVMLDRIDADRVRRYAGQDSETIEAYDLMVPDPESLEQFRTITTSEAPRMSIYHIEHPG